MLRRIRVADLTLGAGLGQADTITSQGTLTILFTDLEGSTDLRVRVGDSVANEVIGLHDGLVRNQLEQSGSLESKSLGDGFMALFSSARQAIDAAVAIQRAVGEHNEAHPDQAISVRIGLNSGDVTREIGDAHGTAVHAASRIADKAQGGQILMAQIVQDLAGKLPETRIVDRGLFWLKGFPDRWRLFEVLWRQGEPETARATKEVRAASAAAFDTSRPRAEGPLVGRDAELTVIRTQIGEVTTSGLRAVVLEGEAGIGKTRMLEATADMASESDPPFWVLDVTADPELRGPFLLFRSLLTSPRTSAIAKEAMALEALDRAQDAIAGRGVNRDEGLTPQEQILRTFDEVATAFSALTRERPLALLFNDLQWADEDSLQLIRYLVRTLVSAPIFMLINLRPYSDSSSGGAGKLIADLDRMRVTRALRLERLTRAQTSEVLEHLLGAPVDDPTLRSLHARSEGVPFFIEEFARAYREAEALQLMDGTWTMTRLSGPTVPSSVQSLIERRLAQLDEDCRSLLADAGVLGRRVRLSDLSRVLARIRRDDPIPEWQLEEDLQNAIDLGLIVRAQAQSGYDFSFSHDQIRAALVESSSRARQRAIHQAMAEILAEDDSVENLSMLAYHSMHAGDDDLAVATAIKAARNAMDLSAPEESVRLIDGTLPIASDPQDRIEMLRVKDDALAMADRGADRMANLAEMSALTGAVPSTELETEVKLRRASAARSIQDFDTAVELARSVRDKARGDGNHQVELQACFELGQALTRAPLGEGYMPLLEVDLDACEEVFGRALDLARDLGARSDEAAALRELAMIEAGRVKHQAIEAVEQGTTRLELLAMAPEMFTRTKELAEQALQIYDELGDHRGSMSSLISMAYAHVTDPSPHGMAGRLEHIRTLHNSRAGEVTDSQRAQEDALMLYSIHSFARLNLQPDLALERGRQAFEAARSIGDRWLECLSAGGVALSYVSIGHADEAAAWLQRAASAAMSVPSTPLARRLEIWRGALAACNEQADEMFAHYDRAAELAGEKNPAGRLEACALLAMEAARLGLRRSDQNLVDRAEAAAGRVLSSPLSSETPWYAVAHAALSVVARANGSPDQAADEARTALASLNWEDHLCEFIDVLWAAGMTLVAQGEPEADELRRQIAEGLGFVGMSIGDPNIRSAWFDVLTHRELAEIAGFGLDDAMGAASTDTLDLSDTDVDLLREMASGTIEERETAAGHNDEEIGVLLEKLGVGSEAEAIGYAIKAGITWQ